VYRILLRHSPVVQPLSVDEAYLDLTPLGFGCGSSEVQQLVGQIRQEIEAATGCTASAGRAPFQCAIDLKLFLTLV
jgi:DNA polymerase-4